MTSADLISSSLAESHIITAYLGFNLGILLISADLGRHHTRTRALVSRPISASPSSADLPNCPYASLASPRPISNHVA